MKYKSFFGTCRTSFLLGLCLILWGCNSAPHNRVSINESKENCVRNYDEEKDYFPEKVNPEYAKGFQVEYQNHYKKVTVKQPWEDTAQNLDYIFVQCGTPIPKEYTDATIVEIPTKRIIAMSTNMVFNAILAYFYGYVGLAMATALSAFVNMALLYRGLHIAGVYHMTKRTLLFILRLMIAGATMVAVIVWQLADMSVWLDWDFARRGGTLGMLIALGTAVYLAVVFLLGVRLKDLKAGTE